ncbi:beta-ketoacyl-[acyl-carrier-protein] synthase family protein [Gillisia hiemivivida]|uniref:Beta-ketoacyl-[acyl-carrier-protein] synthase family protein n=1 Tax=Gillisia hiemivivida TaxID=291190 RepID=A0A5C6ZUW1_9FLAO|nr:beta-ketoacyl-[acyl-carrier-protein] synthase family protein [Gillisia hiemivivida]TXD94181.1 beta-ketoacyl-[acyl-carrier-protein] synthase family protein [Gillisia hiemivivida]
MNSGVAITGMGIISALGNGVEANFNALIKAQDGICFPEMLKTKHTSLPVGEVKTLNLDFENKLQLADNRSYTRAALLGIIAAKEAIKSSGLNAKELLTTGFISGSSVGGMDATEKYYLEYESSDAHHQFIPAQHPGFTTNKISEHLNIKGFTTTISTACSSGANAIMLGARLIKAGELDRVIVGGTDCLTKFTLNGFNSLKILSEEKCKAFDDSRNGLNLGEGAAYLVLEAENLAKDKRIIGRVLGYGNANDAYHQTAASETGEGAYKAMKDALEVAGIGAENIDYINAHGTATRNNDLSETNAIKQLFTSVIPDLSSTKAFTGHTLAAAGALEAVFSILSLQNNLIFPNLNFSKPMKESGLLPITELQNKTVNYVLSNSFGFGGNCTSLIFSKNE